MTSPPSSASSGGTPSRMSRPSPRFGEYLRERRRQAHPAGAAVALRQALPVPGNAGPCKLGAVVEIIHTATLVHDDIIDEAQTRRGRPAANTQLGQFQVRAGGRLALHAGVQGRGAGAQLPHPGYADRADAADGGRRTAADGKARQADLAGRAFRSDLPQDRLLVFRLHATGRDSGRARRRSRKRAAGAIRTRIWAWLFRSWTMCST